MFSEKVIKFLKQLSENNNREWFNENKATYLACNKEVENAVVKLVHKINNFDPSIGNLEPKDSMFRIYRDVRFSHDKSPYKTNMGAVFAQGGRKSTKGCYYMHIEPNDCFIGGGIYMPETAVLKLLRKEIYYNAEEFKKILNGKDFKNMFPSGLGGDKLVKAPKDFPADFPDIELLKHKHYFVWHQVADSDLSSKDYLNKVVEVFKLVKPFNDFLNRAIEG